MLLVWIFFFIICLCHILVINKSSSCTDSQATHPKQYADLSAAWSSIQGLGIADWRSGATQGMPIEEREMGHAGPIYSDTGYVATTVNRTGYPTPISLENSNFASNGTTTSWQGAGAGTTSALYTGSLYSPPVQPYMHMHHSRPVVDVGSAAGVTATHLPPPSAHPQITPSAPPANW